MATSYNSVPLGQAGTGAAYVLDQRQALAPFQTFASMSANKAALERERAKQQAVEDEKIRARQAKLLETPSEFGFYYNQEGQRRAKDFYSKWSSTLAQQGGRATPEQEYLMQREQKDLTDFQAASKDVVSQVGEVIKPLMQDKEYDVNSLSRAASGIYTDQTGNPRNPLEITPDVLNNQIVNNYRLYNKGKVIDNFVGSQAKQYFEKFASNGRFDEKTVITNNLPIEVVNGQIQYDKNGRPKLRVTEELLFQASNNPKLNNLLDGLMEEEEEKRAANPNYQPKTRPLLLEELLQGEVEVKQEVERRRIPTTSGSDKGNKYTSELEKRKQYLARISNGDEAAYKSLVGPGESSGEKIVKVEYIQKGQPESVQLKPGDKGYDVNNTFSNFFGAPSTRISDKTKVKITVSKGFKSQSVDGEVDTKPPKREVFETLEFEAGSKELKNYANNILNFREGEAKIRIEDINDGQQSTGKYDYAAPSTSKKGKYDYN